MRQSPTLLLALAGVTLGSSLYARQANRNDLQGAGATNCAKNIVIFARGTTEQGNVGNIAGPPFFDALGQQVGAGNLAVQGVDYPASIAGFLAGGDADGSKAMANLTQKAITACPNSKVIMSGYSQGAQLVHNGAGQLPANITSKVAGVIMFGDPNNGTAVTGVNAAKTKVFCHDGDNICEGGNLVLAPHLAYGDDADNAASFAARL